jgi:hypothetical protein
MLVCMPCGLQLSKILEDEVDQQKVQLDSYLQVRRGSVSLVHSFDLSTNVNYSSV